MAELKTVKIVAATPSGYAVVNADAVPEGAVLWKPKRKYTKRVKPHGSDSDSDAGRDEREQLRDDG